MPIIAALAALVLVVVTIVIVIAVRPQDADAPRVSGNLTLIGGGGYNSDSPCRGTTGSTVTHPFDYSDIYGGATVRVLAADGTIIGSGKLSPGEHVPTQPFSASDGCRFEFAVALDSESTRYQLVIGARQPYDFTLGDNLDLSISP